MTDHADTIRRPAEPWKAVERIAESDAGGWLMEFTAQALLAERQQAIDERDAALNRAEIALADLDDRNKWRWPAERARAEQAIYALREIELWPFDVNVTADQDVAAMKERARAALLSLGEHRKVWRCDHCDKSPEWPDGQELRPMGIGSPRCPNCDWKLRLVSLGEQP